MTEINRPPQEELRPWHQELQLHGETQGTLRPDETVAIMGSWVEEKLQDYDNDYKKGLAEPTDYKDARACRLALAELPLLDIREDGVRNAIFDREQELKAEREQIEGVARATIDDKLTGLSRLMVTLNGIEDTANSTYSKDIPAYRERAASINVLIEDHNSWVNRARESSQESPEVLEAHERITKRMQEEAARQSDRTEQTPDDARRKVAEALGDSNEVERQALLGEVAKAAKGTTRIHTDIPNDVMLKSNSGEYRPRSGFGSFGDGLPRDNRYGRGVMLEYGGSAEAMLFAPDTTTRYKTVTKTVEADGRFRKKSEQVTKQVPDGEVPTMVVNPITGQQEPGVKVAYQFNGNQRKEDGRTARYEGPAYITESGREGNQLFIEATLPRSVADKLRQGIVSSPEIARQFAKTLALNNGITEQVWNRIIRPPYDQISDGWEMTAADLQKDTQFGDVRYNVISRRSMKV